ncbi:MAG: IclR family transcriptional regulator [Ideonella sp.]|nr:IclR family transcriptional regulator [Ideonella sp.]
MGADDTDREKYLLNQPRRVPLGFEEHAGDRQFATTLARGIELIRCFSANDTTLSNAEMAERTGLPRPTISRLTYTLVILGYLKPSLKYGKYQLGSALISATYPLMSSIGLRQHARGLMNQLADETGGEVSMGIRDRLNVVLIETSRSHARNLVRPLGPMADIGLSLPIAGTAIGRAWLAACDDATRAAVLNELRVKAPDDWARFETDIHRSLEDCTKLGFCFSAGSLITDICAVGAAYGRTASGEVIAFNCAFAAPMPGNQSREDWLRKDVGPRLMAMIYRLKESRAN